MRFYYFPGDASKKWQKKKNTEKIPLALPIRNVLKGPVYTQLSTYQPHEH